ncbi:MAG TPA: NAD-dependent epimerase/dehydratase family protein [Thermoanaerobaculia bacterium]|nr:NAD-dependent epimerase/dehydratase family protein [Thermoanaerobaculia bacterium]
MKAFVTGASGFVGRELCEQLQKAGVEVVSLQRGNKPAGEQTPGASAVHRDLNSPEPWDDVLQGVDVVFHLAAHVHQMGGGDPASFFRINTDATRRLAEASARVGVGRFVFLSSVKVNGESSGSSPFRETDPPRPLDAYAKSKLAAELELQRLGASGLPFVIARSPLVYGPGVKANFLSLMKIVDRGFPLPLASVRNRRSLIYLGNLVDVLRTLGSNPEAPGATFLVSDGEDLSTPELVRRVAAALNRPARLLPMPQSFLRGTAALLGKKGEIARLTESLAVDISALRSRLGWLPPFTVDEGLNETAAWYREHSR